MLARSITIETYSCFTVTDATCDTIELMHASALVGTIYSQNFKCYFIYDRLQTQGNGYLSDMFFTILEMCSCEI